MQYRSYGVGELAQLYSPDRSQEAARRLLRHWIASAPGLEARLQAMGWRKGAKTLTPQMVREIVLAIGDP